MSEAKPHYRIEPLSQDGNYSLWAVKMRAILTESDLYEHVTGEDSCPSPTPSPAPTGVATDAAAVSATDATDKVKKWKKRDNTALTAIILRVDDDILQHILWRMPCTRAILFRF